MALTINPSTPQEVAINNPFCFEGSAFVSIPVSPDGPMDIPAADDDWTYNASTGIFKKVSGGTFLTGSSVAGDTVAYGLQPFYITGCNSAFLHPGGSYRSLWVIGVWSDSDIFYWTEVWKDCGATPCTSSSGSGSPWFMAVRYGQMSSPGVFTGPVVTRMFRTVNFNEKFYVYGDTTNLKFYHIQGGQSVLDINVPLPESETWRFVAGASYVNNEIWCLKTWLGSYQGPVPITWSVPLGGDIEVDGNFGCFSTDTPGEYQVCIDSDFDEPLCVDIVAAPLYLDPVDLDCGDCIFTGDTVTFTSNGGLAGTLTAIDQETDEPIGTVVDALTWEAPDRPCHAVLTYTLGEDSVTCHLFVVRNMQVLNVNGDTILGLVPGEEFQLETNYGYPYIKWENVNCANLVTEQGRIRIPARLNDDCFGQVDCLIRGRLVDLPGGGCANLTEGANQATITLRIIVDPVFPTPQFGGATPVKWKPDTPDFRVLVNDYEGGCDETYLRNRTPIMRWMIRYDGLRYTFENECSVIGCQHLPEDCCNSQGAGYIGGYHPIYQSAKRLDDFWLRVGGQSGYFTLIDYRTGEVWRRVRFEEKMERDHINWRQSQSRSMTLVWRPCCDTYPMGGVCIHNTCLTDKYPPSVPTNVDATAVSYNAIDVTWDSSYDEVGIAGYQIEVDGEIIDAKKRNVYHHRHLEPVSLHNYRVRAYDFNNNRSQWSDMVSATTDDHDIEAPSVPANLTAEKVNSEEILVEWDASTDNVEVAGYYLLIDGVAVDVGLVTSYSHTGLEDCSLHAYHVRAYDTSGNKSSWSPEVQEYTTCGQVMEGELVVREDTDYVVEG